jgi:glycine/D-amino acid oxidase-like deaminating enzyme
VIAEHNVITLADVEQAQQRAEAAHREAEAAWELVEDVTRRATLAEEAARYWSTLANRTRLQIGFRKPEVQH